MGNDSSQSLPFPPKRQFQQLHSKRQFQQLHFRKPEELPTMRMPTPHNMRQQAVVVNPSLYKQEQYEESPTLLLASVDQHVPTLPSLNRERQKIQLESRDQSSRSETFGFAIDDDPESKDHATIPTMVLRGV